MVSVNNLLIELDELEVGGEGNKVKDNLLANTHRHILVGRSPTFAFWRSPTFAFWRIKPIPGYVSI